MAKITANPDLLERVAGELDRIASDMEAQSYNLSVAGNQVSAVWKSRYTNQFTESITKTRNKASYASGNVRSAAKSLRNIAREVRKAEREIERKNSLNDK